MTVIDTNNGISYPFLNAQQAADIIGVDPSTVYRWQRVRASERYRQFLVIFNEATPTLTAFKYRYYLTSVKNCNT